MNYQKEANKLYKQQAKGWSHFADNLEGLNEVQHKSFNFDGFTLETQFNPKRIISTNAKIDKKSLSKRTCFLCKKHRAEVQKEILFEDKYEILCNPFPILPDHFTISHINHVQQGIKDRFKDLLQISKALPDLFTLYNGSKCGASAPDHHHFQAASKGYLPIEKELEQLKSKYGNTLLNNNNAHVSKIDDGLRRFITLESDNIDRLEELFNNIYAEMPLQNNDIEPMINILSWYEKNKWIVCVFLREKHRPWQYFEDGEKNILISPGSTDCGGILITPLEKDFKKVTKDDLSDIMKQVFLNSEDFNKFCSKLSNL